MDEAVTVFSRKGLFHSKIAARDVRSLGCVPFKTFRAMVGDIFRCRIEAVRNRAAWCFGSEARRDVIGEATQQQKEALAVRGEDCVSARGVR